MQTKQNNTALVWFKNDLRVHDNVVLNEAIKNHTNLIACYYFDPREFENGPFGFKKTEKFRAQFLIETVNDLKLNLKALKIELLVFQNKPEDSLPDLIKAHDIKSIYLQKEWTSEEVCILDNVKKGVTDDIIFNEIYNQFLYHPESTNTLFKDIPQVFSNFRRKVEKYNSINAVTDCHPIASPFVIKNTTKIPTLNKLGFDAFETHPHTAFPFKGGETAAIERLEQYLFDTKKIGVYKKTRNGLLGRDYSSKFSPWLANGSLSPKIIYWKIKDFESQHYKNDSTYWLIFELLWRDYFKYISIKHQNQIFKRTGILKKTYHWSTDKKMIDQWINGTTKSPFVNANMIELKKTGWMSNRGRQNVASFFAKELQLDWRIGAAYFEAMLIDYDVHSNYGNWLYVSGVGNDPRDRKFNVEFQAQRYDPQGKYQNLWLQETLF